MKQIVKCFGLLTAIVLSPGFGAAAQVQMQSGSTVQHRVMEDSMTSTKTQLRNSIIQLRDTLYRIESGQAQLQRARASGMRSVVISQGRQLARNCLSGAAMVDLMTERVAPMNTPDPRGDQALQAYRHGLSQLGDELRGCAHFDSLTMAATPLDQEKLENVATAASDAVARYDVIRDGLLKLFGIELPVRGKIYH